MKSNKFIVFSLCALMFGSQAMAANISIDDLFTPAQAEKEEQRAEMLNVQQEDKVSISPDKGIDGKSVVEAASSKDAVNAALKNMTLFNEPVKQVKFPSGLGWVSKGVADYSVSENTTTTYISQRKAYVVAYMNAKKSLAEALFGLSSKGKEVLREQMKTISDDKKDMAQLSSSLTETNEERVSALLRGYVIYDVSDTKLDETQRSVSVAIVTTNKTLNALNRPTSNSINADSLQDGIKMVLAELNSKVAPPVGGTTICVPQTGEMAFIGYGTNVIRSNSNAAVQRKMLINSGKIAQMRARSALVGILNGDNIESISKSDEASDSDYEDFVEIDKQDPLNKNNEKEIVELEKAQNSFKNTQTYNDAMYSFKRGIVPPGVNIKTFVDDKRPVVTAVAIYLPSVSDAAKQLGKAMQEAGNQDFSPERADELNEKSESNAVKPTITSNDVIPGASGQVTNDNDL